MLKDYLLTIIEIVGVFQCLFLAAALLYLPGNHKDANRWLCLLFLVFTLVFAHMVLRQNDLLFLAPLTALLRLPLLFLYGPLLYLYLYQLTTPWEASRAGSSWPHFVAFTVAALVYLPGFALDHIELLHLVYYAELVQAYPSLPGLNGTQQWLWVATTRYCMPVFVFHLGTYMLLCLRLLLLHKQRIRQHFSRLDQVSLDWLRNLLLALLALWTVVAARQLLFADSVTGNLIEGFLVPALVLFLSALGLFGLLQKSIPLPAPASQDSELPAAGTAGEKYQHSTLSNQQQQAILDRLLALMAHDKPHLDSELTLSALAASLELPTRHLSQVINSRLGQNFLDFVNAHRVEEARRLLADSANSCSILTIAMEVGFNSKSAFYNAFKRHTGQTPSGYRSACLTPLVSDAQA